MSLIRRTGSWWSVTSTRARWTAVGASVLVLGLLTTSVIVWTSPANPINEAVAAVSKEQIQQDKVLAERNALLSQVIALQKQLTNSKLSLTASKAQLATIQQQLWSAQGALDAAQTASVAVKAPARKPTSKPAAVTAALTVPTKAQIMAPTSRYFGLYTDQAPFNWASFNGVGVKIGSQPNAVGYFGGWDQNFRGDVVKAAWQRNTLPVLTWESRPIGAANNQIAAPEYSLPKIIGDPAAGVPGSFDAYLHQYAKDIVASGLPLGIRLDHEMNGSWYPWAEDDGKGNAINGNRAGDYAKMWQHVHDIFEQEGANSLVVWVWAPNIVNNLPASHQASAYLDGLYPGEKYVDVVGLSGYLRPAYKPENDFTFDYTFGASLKELRRITSKPILLAEIGASETGGHKVAWINSLFAALAKPENKDIIGFSWFNLAVTTYTEGELATNDWRIESRPDSLAAFSTGLAGAGDNFILKPAK
ncbi:glycosyl hydrolase [Lacisediminihabitans sp.]|uniref:glycosyl hydrolase n=1 Tax=Lacisediminihabitans sp. TaxID=2787631 RepID=UPI002F953A59